MNADRFFDQDHWPFLAWLLVTGFSLFGLAVCWNEGLLALLHYSDRSHICLVIGLLYVVGCAHCGRRARLVSREIDHVRRLDSALGDGPAVVTVTATGLQVGGHAIARTSILGEHLVVLSRRSGTPAVASSDAEPSTALATLVARAKASNDLGWFLIDVLLKLGLLGTIVGFILMLGSVADTTSLDVNTMQKVLKQMSNGMGTALYTTLAGLVGSMVLGLQYLIVDKGADTLIERILRLVDAKLSLT